MRSLEARPNKALKPDGAGAPQVNAKSLDDCRRRSANSKKEKLRGVSGSAHHCP